MTGVWLNALTLAGCLAAIALSLWLAGEKNEPPRGYR